MILKLIKSIIPEDKKNRCGYGSVFSTTWIWKALYRLHLTSHQKDVFEDLCVWHDKMTDEEYQAKLKALGIQLDRTRVQQAFDEASKTIGKETGYKTLGSVYRRVTKVFTRFFD